MLKKILNWFIIICSISAFEIRGLGKGSRVLDILGICLIIFFLLIFIAYQGKTNIKGNFSYHILFLLMAVFFSTLMAKISHKQDIGITLYQQRGMYFLLFYFLLHYLMPNPKELEKIILIFALLFCFMYIIQTYIYPRLITDGKVFRDRGTLRIFMPGSSFMVLGYYISLQQIFEKFNWTSLSILLLTVVVAFLLAGRQLLSSLALLSLMNILINKRIKNRVALLAIFILVFASMAYLMSDTVGKMISVTTKLKSEGTSYIRVRAAEYYLFQYPHDKLSYLFGNGSPSVRSPYGVSLNKVWEYYGFYLSDIGLVSGFFKFGIIFVITILAIYSKIIFSKSSPDIAYIKYFIISAIITMFTTVLIFEETEGIVIICIILYITDYYKYKSLNPENLKIESTENKYNNLSVE
jgi:hypothetical protein